MFTVLGHFRSSLFGHVNNPLNKLLKLDARSKFGVFFCGTFHNIFKLGTYLFLHRYQWKKLPKPP